MLDQNDLNQIGELFNANSKIMFDEILYIKQKINIIHEEMDMLENKLNRIKNMLKEDINRIMRDIEDLNTRLITVENIIHSFQQHLATGV